MHRNKGIVFVRSTNIQFDSRIQKEITSALKAGYKCIVLAWDRENHSQSSSVFKTAYGNAEVIYYQKSAKFGGGFASVGKFIGFNKWLYSMLKKLVNEYSIIHACDLDTAIPCKLICKKYNKYMVYDIFDYYIHSHSIPTKLGKTIVSHLENRVINKAYYTIICNEQRLEQIKHAKPKKVEIIHNTPDIGLISEKVSLKDKESKRIKVVYVGVLLDNRLLIEVINKIKELDDIELYIGGFGILEKEVSEYDKKFDNIHFCGQMEYKQVLELENRCDIMFATYNPDVANHKYSAPNKIYEAMALGKPIIVCKGTGIDVLVEKEGIGIAINYDGKEFIEAIDSLKSKETRNKMGEKGKLLYNQKYSWAVMEKKLFSIYEDIFNNDNPLN